MKKIEYFFNLIHYGFYIFFYKLFRRGIDPVCNESREVINAAFISKGIGLCFDSSLNLVLFSIYLIINKIIGGNRIPPFGVFIFLMIVAYGISYYFIYRKAKHLIYVKEFKKEGKDWRYILISFGFMIISILFFIFSLKVTV